jgi:hypothetical protein
MNQPEKEQRIKLILEEDQKKLFKFRRDQNSDLQEIFIRERYDAMKQSCSDIDSFDLCRFWLI